MVKFRIPAVIGALALFLCLTVGSFAQSVTAGDISGAVTDTTGAIIPNATITVTNPATGETKSATSGTSGSYRISLLSPGTYKVTASAPGFSTITTTITVGAGSVTTDNLKLSVGQASTTVEVSASPEIVNTTNGDITTVFTSEQVQALPNPGNDLTFVAQTAPGSVMNTGTAAGGYGNFSSFGISGLSNMFTLDGGYENDPFLNLNNTGASNLTLGNNEVDTVTVVSPAFSSQFGGLGGAQVNEITSSGTNRFHGNANYWWDGRATNANDWFNKQNQAFNSEPNQPVFVNANQWGAAIGGPIFRDRLFFFVNTEGIRAVTPATGQVWVPSQALQNCALGNDGPNCTQLNAAADANCANNPNSTCVGNGEGIPFTAAPTNQQPLLKTIFNTYNNSPLRPKTGVTADPNDVSADTFFGSNSAKLSEWLLTARLDYRIGAKDNFYIHYKQDHGTQPTYTDLVSPLFTTASIQPAWEGQMNETHTFSPNLTNQLVITGNYYSAPFLNSNNYEPVAPSTIFFDSGDLANTTYGGINYDFPQGRRVAGYQVIDDVSYTKGRNTMHFGYNFRRDNITDIQGVLTISPEDITTTEGFTSGAVDIEHAQRFPLKPTYPVAVYNQGAYFEDAYKLAPNFTLTLGLRAERNSNPTCLNNCLQVLAFQTSALPTGTTVPYNAAFPGGYIQANRHQAFTGYQSIAIMPRVGFNWQPFTDGKTVIRGGFGMFADTFPGLIADDLLSNAPNNFHAAVFGAEDTGAVNLALDPTTAGSGFAVATASSNAFQTSFKNGGTYASTKAAVAAAGGTYSAPSFTTTAPFIKYPTYEEYSLAIERRIDSKSTVSVTYAGNHGYHEPVLDASRNLTSATAGVAGFFPTVASVKPITSFASITNVYSGASSNFNGVVFSATRRSKALTLQFNYEFSKALDEISNGGLEPFAPDAGDSASVSNPANLHSQYGPADYNVKHNLTSSFVYELPSYGHGMLRTISGGFEFSGGFFHNSGLPYSVTQSLTSITGPGSSAFSNGTVILYAKELNNSFDHHCGGGSHALLPDGSVASQCNFVNSFAPPTNFAQQGRNSLIGPSYTNANFGAFKVIPIPHSEIMKLKLGAQFFNLFNHPNFQNPSHSLTSTNQTGTLGSISSTVGAPTSILGSTGGSDASPRLIQLHGTFTF
jgi:hypothetical protein